MLGRCVAVLILSCLAAGCARDPITLSSSLEPPGLGMLSSGGESHSSTRVYAATTREEPRIDYLRQKTMAGKVLTAIAFERVTGRKTDPARLSELD